MADKYYNYENSNACSSSSGDRDHRQSDEMSLFLRQILLRPPSSPPSYMARAGPQTQLFSPRDYLNRSFPLPLAQAEIPSVGFPDGVSGPSCGSSLSGSLRRISAANVPSSSVGGFSENETDECESEEGLEALIDEVPAKSASPRKSSKRSRAAEVHNLSEKRRRSRINEKMKALQNLIPNSNKTDKASMLDEAIEYLQQLQLQVQMLSLRNGISLYPISMPGLLQPLQLSRMEFGEENGPQHAGMAGRLSLNQESLPHAVLGLQNKRTLSNQQALPDMSRLINSETTFSLESSFRGHFGPFPLHASSQEICRDDVLQHQQPNANLSERKPESGARAKALLPFETKASNLEDSSFAEACMIGRDQTGGLLMKHLERNLMPSQDSDINSEACWTDVT